MDIGSGIATGSAILGSVAVAFKILSVIKPNGNGTNGHCKDHSGICTAIEDISSWLDKIDEKLDRVIERRAEPRV